MKKTKQKKRFSEKYAFWGKNQVSEILGIFWSDLKKKFLLILLVQLAFLKLLIWTSCSSNLKLVLKSP